MSTILDRALAKTNFAVARASQAVEASRVPADKKALTTAEVIALADKHLGGDMASSALLALRDARALYEAGDLNYARARALRSLAYSVGIFHPVYLDAARVA